VSIIGGEDKSKEKKIRQKPPPPQPLPSGQDQKVPWDSQWKAEEFKPGDMPAPLLDESSFATLFPRYREKYLRDIWPLVNKQLQKYSISCTLDLREGSMTVRTTRKTWDPWAIINARDFIKLLSRSVPLQQAVRIFQDDITSDIIKIGGATQNKEKFVKRRQRLIGPNGQTLKAIEMLTQCYVMVQGSTVAAMGKHTGLKQVRKIVEDCMKNIHPVYNIKALMVKRELNKDPEMASEDWERFLPKFKKQNIQTKVKKIQAKKKYTPFPPEQQPRKVDLEIETGEFFLKQYQKDSIKRKEKREKQAEKAKEREDDREKAFQAPKEDKLPKPNQDTVDVKAAVDNIKKIGHKRKKSDQKEDVQDYIVSKKRKQQ